jgi:hypothetical protein
MDKERAGGNGFFILKLASMQRLERLANRECLLLTEIDHFLLFSSYFS